MRRGWFWKLYLALMVLLLVGGIIFEFYHWELVRIFDLIKFLLYVLQLIGLFGFVYWRRIASAVLWKFVFAVAVCQFLYECYLMAVQPLGSFLGNGSLVALGIVGFAINFPFFVALYIYGFRSHRLWATAT
jgi:hypothetical protein